VNTNGCNANTFCSSLGPLGFTAITVTRGLINKFNKKEFEAVVAHECAHILYEDSVRGIVMDILLMCISKIVAWDDAASPAHIPMMTFVLLREVMWLWEYLQNGLSRNQEYCADEFAAKVIGERYAISMLQKLEPIHRFKFLQNLGEYIAQIFEHKCTYPTTSNRIKAIRTSSYSPFIRWG
jgi:Zn-dependent protease with chaperone function